MDHSSLGAWKERYNEWAIKAYNEAIKTKTISRYRIINIITVLLNL